MESASANDAPSVARSDVVFTPGEMGPFVAADLQDRELRWSLSPEVIRAVVPILTDRPMFPATGPYGTETKSRNGRNVENGGTTSPNWTFALFDSLTL
jgi:hypothetical protein